MKRARALWHDRFIRAATGSRTRSSPRLKWLNEAWVGGEQVRAIRFEGDRLFIESPPMPHPNVNNKVVRVIVIWEREKT